MAAAEAASKAAAKAAAGEALTDADISAMVTVTQDANLAKSLTAETLAQSYMSASKVSDVDKSNLANSYLAALVARGDISESDITASDTMAKAMSFLTDFALSKTAVPVVGQLATKIGLPPVATSLASNLISTEGFITSQSRQSFAQHQAAKALGLSTESTEATMQAGSGGSQSSAGKESVAGAVGGSAQGTPQPATSTTMASKETASVKQSLADRPVLGMAGIGRSGTMLTGPQGIKNAPKLKRNTLLGG
ncbi:hypothetical protein DSCW_01930 [Desulfosarcina widdelii]|uniref:Uncharacterized protein n=1 Tax=Desulfosarcina widdelii TaxID=947919 RepID=A0A5K7YTV5_9BACT|nr:hypothetical protein [Desulfosarcina widdelii]BBO72776.1 hypothetical protein DSCW_01930 [Desulfosarcina widdelii]